MIADQKPRRLKLIESEVRMGASKIDSRYHVDSVSCSRFSVKFSIEMAMITH